VETRGDLLVVYDVSMYKDSNQQRPLYSILCTPRPARDLPIGSDLAVKVDAIYPPWLDYPGEVRTDRVNSSNPSVVYVVSVDHRDSNR
jgi:hypothetical protein